MNGLYFLKNNNTTNFANASNTNSNTDLDTIDDNMYDDDFKNNLHKVIPEKNFQKNCSTIYISTKTKILFLSTSIDIFKTFWILPITEYDKQQIGIVKKQIKLSFDVKEDYEKMLLQLDGINNVHNKIITHIDSNNRFKHVRKISVGLCKKDLLYARNKEKSAFYNCFVLSLRIHIDNSFKECTLKYLTLVKLKFRVSKTMNN